MHGLSQTELSEACDHQQAWCSKIERGLKEPTLRDLAILSHLYGLQLTRGDWSVRARRGAESPEVSHA